MANQTLQHRISVCTLCKHAGGFCAPGLRLIEQLNEAICAAGPTLDDSFEVTGTACLAGCGRPCTVAFSASQKTSYLFGDIKPDEDIEALVTFAKLYADRPDGMSKSGERPAQLLGKTLARIPAACIVTQAHEGSLQ